MCVVALKAANFQLDKEACASKEESFYKLVIVAEENTG